MQGAGCHHGSKQRRKLRSTDPKFYDSTHDAAFGTECNNAHVFEVFDTQAQKVVKGHMVLIEKGRIFGQPAAAVRQWEALTVRRVLKISNHTGVAGGAYPMRRMSGLAV